MLTLPSLFLKNHYNFLVSMKELLNIALNKHKLLFLQLQTKYRFIQENTTNKIIVIYNNLPYNYKNLRVLLKL